MAYPCRLRAYRKSSGLSQRELAALLGLQSQGLIAEYETGKKHPGANALIGCALIFDRPIRMIFPRLHSTVALEICARAKRLQAGTSKRRRPRASAKLSKLIMRAKPDN